MCHLLVVYKLPINILENKLPTSDCFVLVYKTIRTDAYVGKFKTNLELISRFLGSCGIILTTSSPESVAMSLVFSVWGIWDSAAPLPQTPSTLVWRVLLQRVCSSLRLPSLGLSLVCSAWCAAAPGTPWSPPRDEGHGCSSTPPNSTPLFSAAGAKTTTGDEVQTSGCQ